VKLAWVPDEIVSCADHGPLSDGPLPELDGAILLLRHRRDAHGERVHEALRKHEWAKTDADMKKDREPALREPADIAAFTHVAHMLNKIICGDTLYRENGEYKTVHWDIYPTGTVVCGEGWDAITEDGFITGFRRIEEKNRCGDCKKPARLCRCTGGPYPPAVNFALPQLDWINAGFRDRAPLLSFAPGGLVAEPQRDRPA